jgi:hypothetical protein
MTEFLMMLLKAILSRMMVDEALVSIPGFARWVIIHSSRLVLHPEQERCRDEWLSDSAAQPTTIRKLLHAFDTFRGAYRIRCQFISGDGGAIVHVTVGIIDRVVGVVSCIVLIPVLVVIFPIVFVLNGFRGPILVNYVRTRRGIVYSECLLCLAETHTAFDLIGKRLGLNAIPLLFQLATGKYSLVGRRPIHFRCPGEPVNVRSGKRHIDNFRKYESESFEMACYLAHKPGLLSLIQPPRDGASWEPQLTLAKYFGATWQLICGTFSDQRDRELTEEIRKIRGLCFRLRHGPPPKINLVRRARLGIRTAALASRAIGVREDSEDSRPVHS